MSRTLLVFHLGGTGGPGRSLLPMAEALAEDGTLETLVPEPGWVADEYGRLGAVTVARYGALAYARRPAAVAATARRFATEVRGFRAAFRARRPDLVVVVTSSLPAALLAARLERIPALVYAAEIHDQLWKRSRARRLWGALLARGTLRAAGAVVCNSRAVAAQFGAAGTDRVTVAYPAIGEDVAGGDRDGWRRRHGLEDADPCLLVVGAISRGRGQDVAVRALQSVRERHPRARLALVGEPHPRPVDLAYAEELRELARELGVADAVVFAGVTDRIADAYAAADVVLNPARLEEAFGRVAPEALVAGRPVAATRVGAVEEVVRDGETGLLVAPGDPEALAGAALRLHEDAELRGRLVEAGRADVRARFTAERNRAVFARAIERVRAEGWAG